MQLIPINHVVTAGPNAGKAKVWIETQSHTEGTLLVIHSEWGDDYTEVLLSPKEANQLGRDLSR